MINPFTYLSEGPALLSLIERCNDASSQAYYDPKPAQALGADPEAAQILPLFGFKREKGQTPAHLGRTTTYELWRAQHPFPQFWTALKDDLAKAIVAEAQSDGALN